MDPLFFIGIIVIFSILDSIARKRRTGMQPPETSPEHEKARTGVRTSPPAYDVEPSYDEIAIAEEEEEERERARSTQGSSETLVPQDLWDEIAGLMKTAQRSRTKTATAGSAPRRSTKTPAPRPTSPRRTGRAAPAPPTATAPASVSHGRAVMPGASVHRSHREYGTDPSLRGRSEQDGLDPLARALGADEATARQQLRGRSRHALRQAIIMQEILGPPAALRPDGILRLEGTGSLPGTPPTSPRAPSS